MGYTFSFCDDAGSCPRHHHAHLFLRSDAQAHRPEIHAPDAIVNLFESDVLAGARTLKLTIASAMDARFCSHSGSQSGRGIPAEATLRKGAG